MRVTGLPLAVLAVVVGIGLLRELPRNRPEVMGSGARLVEIGRFEQPTYVTAPRGDRRLFVVEKTGRIWVVMDGRRLRRPFLDLSSRVARGGEDGLLSLAFSPDYARSRRLYVDFTERGSGDTVLLELRRDARDPAVVDPNTGRTVLRISNPTHQHHGGLITFGSDGLLYVGQGEGGVRPETLEAQRLGSLHGKILRIDPRAQDGASYRVPPSNPLVGRPGRDEILALGLRNPWRFAFSPTGDSLYIGDVGAVRVEEIDALSLHSPVASNFGWPCREGTAIFRPTPYARPWPEELCPDDIPPVYEVVRVPHPADEPAQGAPVVMRSGRQATPRFVRGAAVCSVTGGVFVRDRRLRHLYGRYLFGDFCDPTIRSLRVTHGRAESQALDLSVGLLSSFGEDAIGRIYLTSLSGPVFRLEPR